MRLFRLRYLPDEIIELDDEIIFHDNDILVTKRVAEAGEIMGIHLLDHLKIGDNKYTSLKEKEYM